MWEYLSLYSERNDGKEVFNVKHYPERGNKIAEDALINQLAEEGWELFAIVPAYAAAAWRSTINSIFAAPEASSAPPAWTPMRSSHKGADVKKWK